MILVPTTGQSGSRVIMNDLHEHGFAKTPRWSTKTGDDKHLILEEPVDDYISQLDDNAAIKIRHLYQLDLFPEAQVIALFRHPAYWLAGIMRKRKDRRCDFYVDFNRELLNRHKERPFLFVEYGEDYIRDLKSALGSLGVEPKGTTFKDKMLKKKKPVRPTNTALQVYNELREARDKCLTL